MIITGSALFIEAGKCETVLDRLRGFPEVTYQAGSESGTELVINLEAEDHAALEELCERLKEAIPEIVEIAHFSINFEEEIEKIEAGKIPRSGLREPDFPEPGDASTPEAEGNRESTEGKAS